VTLTGIPGELAVGVRDVDGVVDVVLGPRPALGLGE
jgi:hypothetical protein